MFAVFREYSEQCRVIFKSEILREPIHGKNYFIYLLTIYTN